uniref:Putative secreted protein n=1 Tax=Ixodes ricinus TaxID=34613 RepID=A0A6B0U0J8_IXORI
MSDSSMSVLMSLFPLVPMSLSEGSSDASSISPSLPAFQGLSSCSLGLTCHALWSSSGGIGVDLRWLS